MKKIAVIIPNYNGFSYSERCFRSLENQTFKDFQVCVVDDCSTDNSFELLQEYAKNSLLDIIVIRSEENRGPGHSRKIGIEATNSEWIAFCDIDDWYDKDFLEVQLRNAENSHSDLVMCDHKYVYGDGTVVKCGSTNWCRTVEPSKKNILAYARMSLWRLLAKRDLFNAVDIPEIYYGEDAPVAIQLIANSNRTFVDFEAHYNYLIRENSASASINPRACQDFLDAFKVIMSAIGRNFPEEASYIGINMVLYGVTLMMLKRSENYKKISNVVSDFEVTFPKWAECKYLVLLDKKKKIYLSALKHRLISVCLLYAALHSFLIAKRSRA
ncbi:MAG: glycosyltransferase family 2 protein [Fibrobacter sp.]|nr:glycosyltransferase family 2 protein [Fibrobacter sp.]